MKERILGYDIIKCLAIFCVVIYHFGCVDFGQFENNGEYFPNFTKIIFELLACSVPLFFIVNGALVGNRIMSLIRICKYFLLSIIWPILFHIYIFPILGIYSSSPLSFKNALFSMDFKGVYWFLFTIGLCYLINNISCYFKVRRLVFFIILFCPFITNFLWMVILLINPQIYNHFWGHWGLYTLYSYVYFNIGYYYSNMEYNKIEKLKYLVFAILGWGLLIFEVVVFSNYTGFIYDGVNSSFPTLGALLLSLGIFINLKDIRNINNTIITNYINFIGRNTMGIYVFHMFFIYSYRYYFSESYVNPLIVLIFSFVIINITAVISEFLNHTYFRYLFK